MIAAVIATRNRAKALQSTLESLAAQTLLPEILVVVDASESDESERALERFIGRFPAVRYVRATQAGAASQRNEGVEQVRASTATVLFLDDDVRLAPDCVERMWSALESDPRIGGVNATISNQRYTAPGLISRTLFRFLHGKREVSYAGLCIGPAFNVLPEDRSDLPEVVPVEWLNTTCSLYRAAALPEPPFPERFVGYSLLEDVALSLTVAKTWKLANARTARIVHESETGTHKDDAQGVARMELVNRHFVMTQIMGRRGASAYLRFAVLECFHLASDLRSRAGLRRFPRAVNGKFRGMVDLLTRGKTA